MSLTTKEKTILEALPYSLQEYITKSKDNEELFLWHLSIIGEQGNPEKFNRILRHFWDYPLSYTKEVLQVVVEDNKVDDVLNAVRDIVSQVEELKKYCKDTNKGLLRKYSKKHKVTQKSVKYALEAIMLGDINCISVLLLLELFEPSCVKARLDMFEDFVKNIRSRDKKEAYTRGSFWGY